MLQIVVPMAGRGSRFAEAGYQLPKPLIDVAGKPMIERVVENLRPAGPHRFIFLVLREHDEAFALTERLQEIAFGSVVITVSGITEGAACTVLLAEPALDPNQPLMIANSDQWVEGGVHPYLDAEAASGADGFIMTMTADDPKWSFVGVDADGFVTRVVEKVVISNEATVGIYNFRRAGDFVDAARAMISARDRVNGEYYVAPAYNYLIREGRQVRWFNVGAEADGMHGLGTPADLTRFLDTHQFAD